MDGYIGNYVGIPLETANPKDSEVVVLRFDPEKVELDTVRKQFKEVSSAFPKNKVLALPTNMSLEVIDPNALEQFQQTVDFAVHGHDWFGVVRWCDEDIRSALRDQGHDDCDAAVELIREKIFGFEEGMVVEGWGSINAAIEDNWDELVAIRERERDRIYELMH